MSFSYPETLADFKTLHFTQFLKQEVYYFTHQFTLDVLTTQQLSSC
ncbi:hypothetical protein COO91_07024 [Nostoc flagelliforme CCNUN1]|uniref:Uncharacterized protein n=1 Tax=Nostoc flagelliforme CCNUN1 TaxID=2038116 RepID=A0A2K8SZW0_9NOSO|nr:hypothetical protein COO91_07024 [Nostoc flagelliforme CCNUN1]